MLLKKLEKLESGILEKVGKFEWQKQYKKWYNSNDKNNPIVSSIYSKANLNAMEVAEISLRTGRRWLGNESSCGFYEKCKSPTCLEWYSLDHRALVTNSF